MYHLCRMTYTHSLDKIFDGVKDMKIIQNKTQTSSNAYLVLLDKTKNQTVAQGKSLVVWLGFKAMNALTISKGFSQRLIEMLASL